jgi:protein SCO1/2
MAIVSVASETPASEVRATGGDFTLSSVNGPLALSDLRGKVVLMFFGYTSCPDVCPITLAVISKVFAAMTPQELEKVTALFVSLDPERDTPDLLSKYTGYFHPKIRGVTDRPEIIGQVLKDYGVRYERKEMPGSALGYVISHTPDILVVDRDGRLQQRRFPPNTGVEDIATYVRSLM